MRFIELREGKKPFTRNARYYATEHLAAIEDEAARNHVAEWLNGVFQNAPPPKAPNQVVQGTVIPWPNVGYADVLNLAKAVHEIPDQHMREFVAHWLMGARFVGTIETEQGWLERCLKGGPAKVKMARRGSWVTFDRRYKPLDFDGMLNIERERIPPGTDERFVWSAIIDDDRDTAYLLPGYHHQAYSYVVCEVPYGDDELQKIGYVYD